MRILVLALAVMLSTASTQAQMVVTRTLALPGAANHFVVDEAAQIAFITLPLQNRVAQVSLTENMAVLAQIPTGFRPFRVALSVDQRYLFTTLGTSGSFTRYDRATGALPVQETVIATALDHANTYDIVAGIGSDVFVSASPSSSGFAYIVRVDTTTGLAARVASERIIRAEPVFAIDRAAGFLYVGEGFSPNSLYKLDILNVSAPIVAEDQHGSVFGTSSIALNPSGTRLITGAGQLVRTSDITQAAYLGGGLGAFRPDGSILGVLSANAIMRYDADSLDSLTPIDTSGCGFTNNAVQFKALSRGDGWLLLSPEGVLCKIDIPDVLFAHGFE